MKVYGFTFGIDGFRVDEAPAFEEHVYKNKKKSFCAFNGIEYRKF